MHTHTTVLLQESVDALTLTPKSVVVDATAGQGGHAQVIARHLGTTGTLVCIDQDTSSLAASKEALAHEEAHILYVQGNFRALTEHMTRLGINTIDAALFDLGWHQGQLDSGRGFSFKEDAPLLMTLATNPEPYQITAADIIADWDEEELVNLFKSYGDEPFSGRIARTIVETRRTAPITTARALAELIKSAVPARFRNGKIHPATRVFQALRIAVNDEIGALTEGITAAISLLAPKGRVAIITFHSLEDRTVKQLLKDAEAQGLGTRVNKKVITPSREEVRTNPRARSAKLRIFEKHG